MSKEAGTLEALAEQLALAVMPLKSAVADAESFRALLQRLGWDAQDLPTQWSALGAKIGEVVVALDTLRANCTRIAALTALQKVASLYEAITAIDAIPAGITDPPAFLTNIARQLFDLLLVDYLSLAQPVAASLLRIAGVITETPHEETTGRPPYVESRFRLEELRSLISNPGSIANRLYGWGSQDINFDLLATHLHELSIAMGLDTRFGPPDPILAAGLQASPDQTVRAISSQLSIALAELNIMGQPSEVGLALLELPPEADHPAGLILQPLTPSTIGVEEILGEGWKLQLRAGSDVARTFGIILRPDGIGVRYPLQPGTAPPSVGFGMALVYAPTEPTLLCGSPGATRLEFKGARAALDFSMIGDQFDFSFGTELHQLTLVLNASEGDSFIQKTMGGGESRIGMSLGIVWSYLSGLKFQGGVGLETTLPISVDLFNSLRIDSVYLALRTTDKEDTKKNSAIQAVVATTATVQLGPVSAVVEQFGLQATLSFPEKGGNLGVANLDLGFKPPKGVGLAINAQAVTGSGYLSYDSDKEQYTGLLQLEIAEKISLSAVGLLTTRMPDGSKGFSLLVLMSARFEPGIQLGYGFTLHGLGGLLGVNRTVSVDVLRDGLRSGALSSILFPQQVIENATQIVSNLSTIFPPASDRFLFGPMAIIHWGGPSPLLRMELGIVLEVPEPARLLVMGRLRVTLPNAEGEGGAITGRLPTIRLQLDALGVIDFESGNISLDAVLYDSVIGSYAVTGEMALRANFGAQPMFLLSVGGFHPAFQAPAGFPTLERVTFSLAKQEAGAEVRLQLSAYLAVTSNTIQFGAHLDLLAQVGKFQLAGQLGFDALIHLQPFGLLASFQGAIAVRVKGTVLMGVTLQMNLTGPSPWHAWGKAKFKFLMFSATKEFDVHIGDNEPPPLPPPMHVLDELATELVNPNNWSSLLPPGQSPLVTFRTQPVSAQNGTGQPPLKRLLIHPLAELQVSQRRVPLDDVITRFNNSLLEEGTTFTITAKLGSGTTGESAPVQPVSDWFAPAQFHVMSDAEQLAAPSFSELHSGIRFGAGSTYHCESVVSKKLSVKTFNERDITSPVPMAWPPQVAALGAAGKAPIRATGPAKYRDPSRRREGLTFRPASFRVIAKRPDAVAIGESPDRSTQSYSAARLHADHARLKKPQLLFGVVPDSGVLK